MGSRRFEITETAGSVKGFYVVVDRETGVNYLVAKFGTGGGICPLIPCIGCFPAVILRTGWKRCRSIRTRPRAGQQLPAWSSQHG